jgi:hypothetical protein
MESYFYEYKLFYLVDHNEEEAHGVAYASSYSEAVNKIEDQYNSILTIEVWETDSDSVYDFAENDLVRKEED